MKIVGISYIKLFEILFDSTISNRNVSNQLHQISVNLIVAIFTALKQLIRHNMLKLEKSVLN